MSGQAEDDDGEHGLDYAKDQDDVELHGAVVAPVGRLCEYMYYDGGIRVRLLCF